MSEFDRQKVDSTKEVSHNIKNPIDKSRTYHYFDHHTSLHIFDIKYLTFLFTLQNTLNPYIKTDTIALYTSNYKL